MITRRDLFRSVSPAPDRAQAKTIYTSCRFCNSGCGFRVTVGHSVRPETPDLAVVRLPDGNLASLVPDSDCPANNGDYSVRGAFLSQTLYRGRGPTSDRLQYPMVRTGGKLKRASWDEALQLIAHSFTHYLSALGPSSIGFYHSDWFGGESAYAYMKLANLLGITNYDITERLCAATGAAGLMRSLGASAHPWSYADIAHAEAVVLAGSNASDTLSVIYDQIFTQGAKLVVIDVRRTLAAKNAEERGGIFLELRPGTDVALSNAIGNVLINDELIDEAYITAHTRGFLEYKAKVLADYTPVKVSKITGIPPVKIIEAAQIIGNAKATLFLSGKGLEHQAHGTDMICSLINLALMTGNMGKSGGSYSPLGGHQGSIVNPEAFAGQLDHVSIPHKTIFQMMDQIEAGTQKALLVACASPLTGMPDLKQVRRVLGQLELLVAVEIYPNELTEMSHVVLPAASWGESPYTSANSDRTVRFYDSFAPAPGEARPDWTVPAEIGKRMGFRDQFNWSSAEEVFHELKGTTGPLAGLSYERLRTAGSNSPQLPVPSVSSNGTARLYADGKFPTPDGRAWIWTLDYQPQPEPPTPEYPFVLVTGRTNDLWQCGYTFKRTPALIQRLPRNEVQIHPIDAKRLRVETGDKVKVRTRRGAVMIAARVTEDVQPGTIFTLWGYPGVLVNELTLNVRDPISQEPGFKACAAAVEVG